MSTAGSLPGQRSSLRANGSRECAPDDRLREVIHARIPVRKLQPEFPLALAEGAQAQRIELDEARGIAVIIGDRAFLEGDEILIV